MLREVVNVKVEKPRYRVVSQQYLLCKAEYKQTLLFSTSIMDPLVIEYGKLYKQYETSYGLSSSVSTCSFPLSFAK